MSAHRTSKTTLAKLPHTFSEPVTLAIIGGTGLYLLETLKPVARLTVLTPWGFPLSPITISKTESGFPIAFLARHGLHHDLLPTDVPYQANIAALKSLGVKVIVAFSSVGSLQQHIKPRDFVIPSQIIDRTKGIRPSTFFERGFVGHVGFGEPFDRKVGALLYNACKDAVAPHFLHSPETEKDDTVLVCMEGPAFSTRAESRLYRSWGGSVINMSCIPESKLAKEAEISYQMVCMGTDYDAWNDQEEAVTVETVVGNLKANGDTAHKFAEAAIPALEKALLAGEIGLDLDGMVKTCVSTNPNSVPRQLLEKMHFLFPGYWDVTR